MAQFVICRWARGASGIVYTSMWSQLSMVILGQLDGHVTLLGCVSEHCGFSGDLN